MATDLPESHSGDLTIYPGHIMMIAFIISVMIYTNGLFAFSLARKASVVARHLSARLVTV
jgi:hypothetical protein